MVNLFSFLFAFCDNVKVEIPKFYLGPVFYFGVSKLKMRLFHGSLAAKECKLKSAKLIVSLMQKRGSGLLIVFCFISRGREANENNSYFRCIQ